MPVNRAELLADLQKQVRQLEDDIRARTNDRPELLGDLQREHREAVEAGRTADSFTAWLDAQVTQSAVMWVLASVFVRFCEDNNLIEQAWLSGTGDRANFASRREQAFYLEHRTLESRDWLLEAFAHLAGFPALSQVVDAEHNPLHRIPVSADGARALIDFWRQRDESGVLRHDFTDPTLDTRFLGDLYQDLSEDAKKRYALLQTPEFVEEFILDQTMEPALRERPLDGFRMIDPTCGSGHFLLGAFHRLLDRWGHEAPNLGERERVQRALDAVHGVDLNPFAVAIARFRLTVAAMQACGMRTLASAPEFRYHLAVGDSLLHGLDQGELDLGAELSADRTASGFAYAAENLAALQEILQNGRYDCVVGNPPYITVKDKALNQAYRDRYDTCKGKYALTVPFMERFFGLAKPGQHAGWVGQITSNSFMKREFGSKLIEDFLAHRDLRRVVDTSGAYIPGHGTPTVILVGRNHGPVSETVRAVLGIRGEPGRPDDAAKGLVWSSIVGHIDEPGYEDDWVSVANLDDDLLRAHPWSLSGGGAVDLAQLIESQQTKRLAKRVYRIGVFGIMGSDDAMVAPRGYVRRQALETDAYARLVLGEEIRDYGIASGDPTWFPYDGRHDLRPLADFPQAARHLWRNRTELGNRATFSKGTYFSDGRPWYEWHQLPKDVAASPLSIAFAFVATHNHFVLDRGGKVFKQSAPVIKLPENATEDDHLALLGVLNSSVACFWLKQNSHGKGNGGVNEGFRGNEWDEFFEFTGTTLKDYPLTDDLPLQAGKRLDTLAQQVSLHAPAAVCVSLTPRREALDDARETWRQMRSLMVHEQEELDWECYRLYGLIDDDLTYSGGDVPVELGQRAFEIVLARRAAAGDEETAWFERHGSTSVTEIPSHWPEDYRALVQRRIDLIESDRFIRLLERPEYKRRWATEPWEKQEKAALRDWLLDQLEDVRFWFVQGRPTPQSVGQIAAKVQADAEILGVLELWAGQSGVDVEKALASLLADEHVPYLAALRYKPSGLRKRAEWEKTWALQRREDAGEDVGTIPVPPKYGTGDFAKTSYWSHRGKLDVPKERFVSYPHAERENDPSLLLGWAGWDHGEQALALLMLAQERAARDGWGAERLTPLLAGVAELEPWLHQWHADPHPQMGAPLSQFATNQLEHSLARYGLTRDDLDAWRPPAPVRGRRRKDA